VVQNVIEDIATLLFFLVAVGVVLGPSLLVMFTERPSDLAAIKARYEGPQGRAGPNMTVVSSVRFSFGFLGPRSRPARKYQVVLRGTDGREHRRIVGVSAGYLDDGEVDEFLA